MAEPNIALRAITEADLPAIIRWFADPEVTQFLRRDAEVLTMEAEREWLNRVNATDSTTRVWAIEVAGQHIGNCSLSGEPVASLGIAIGEKCAWGKGYGTATVRELLRYGFKELGLQRIGLTVYAPNVRGRGCYPKCGFRYEGCESKSFLKQGVWIDVIRMGILRDEWLASQNTVMDGLCILGPEHTDEVLALWEMCDLWPNGAEDRYTARHALALNARTSIGWRDKGVLVGTAVGAFDGFRGWLYRVAVHTEYRHKGIATAMITDVEEKLQAIGVRQINLMVDKENTDARALYEKLGYEMRDFGLMRKRY